MTVRTLPLGFSPCPNDTFMFHGLVSGRVQVDGVWWAPRLHDIEELNRLALDARPALPVTKISVAAWPRVAGHYRLLRAGAALGFGVGPLLVRGRRRGELADLEALRGRRVAVPGHSTTAALLLRRFAPPLQAVAMRFDRIPAAVAAGEVDAGVLIHEGRFTWRAHGLEVIADLGALWEERERLPLPLGVIVAARELGDALADAVADGIRRSVELARAQPELSADFVREQAQEMDPDVCRRHIELYVNEWSVDLGERGLEAIARLTT